MHVPTGEIFQQDLDEQHKEFIKRMSEYDDSPNSFAPLTDKQYKELTPMKAHQRKGYMRNQPCVCGSGKKFKKCCWSKFK